MTFTAGVSRSRKWTQPGDVAGQTQKNPIRLHPRPIPPEQKPRTANDPCPTANLLLKKTAMCPTTRKRLFRQPMRIFAALVLALGGTAAAQPAREHDPRWNLEPRRADAAQASRPPSERSGEGSNSPTGFPDAGRPDGSPALRSVETWTAEVAWVVGKKPAESPAVESPQESPQAASRREERSRLVFKDRIAPHWFHDNTRFWYRNDLRGGAKEFIVVEPVRRD